MNKILRCIVIATVANISISVPAADLSVPCTPLEEEMPGPNWGEAGLEVRISGDVQELSRDTDLSYSHHLNNFVKEWENLDCTDDIGRSRMDNLLDGLGNGFRNIGNWDRALDGVKSFRLHIGNNTLATIMEAEYWIDYAWAARGSGYASSVTKDGWKLFTERMKIAEKILLDSKNATSSLPVWYPLMIRVQSALGRPETERDKTFLEGVSRYPKFYGTYRTMRYYLDPRWGGSWATVDNFIDWSANNADPVDGDRMYASLYDGLRFSMENGQDFFKTTRANWPRIKKGLMDDMKKYPDSKKNLNSFASFACEAGDKKTYLVLRKKIGKNKMAYGWSQNASSEFCDAKFNFNQ